MQNQNQKEQNKKWWEEHFFKVYLGISISILIICVIIGITNINVLIERAIKIFSFWIILFIIIFLPRRLLINSRKFRYIILCIRKKYPLILYYWKEITILEYVNYIMMYMQYYVNRVNTYIFVGTRIKWLKPYRKNWERGEKIREIIDEMMLVVHYLILYVFKIFYEIINFLDNATIYKIIKSRILGYIIVSIGYIVIGANFFLIYILSLIAGFLIFHIWRIYARYKEFKRDFPSTGKWDNFQSVLTIYGFANKLELFSKVELEEYRIKSFLYNKVFRNKRLTHIYFKKRIYIRYGEKKATKTLLVLTWLAEVEEKTLIHKGILRQWMKIKEEEIEKLNFIQTSKYQFTTRFLIKRNWYLGKKVIYKNKKFDEYYFTESLENMVLLDFTNFLHFKMHLLNSIIMGANVWDENNEFRKEYDWWKDHASIKEVYYKHYINYFEFKEIVKFLKKVEKKMEEYGGSNKFIKECYIDNDIYIKCKMIWSAEETSVNEKEQNFLHILLFLSIYKLIEDIDEKELKEIFEYYKEEIKSLDKSIFGWEFKKNLTEIGIIKG